MITQSRTLTALGNTKIASTWQASIGRDRRGINHEDRRRSAGAHSILEALFPRRRCHREYMAQIEATLGNAGAAVPLLARLLDTPYYFPVTIANLRLDPVWDSIRRDPRFQALLKPDDDASNVAQSGGG